MSFDRALNRYTIFASIGSLYCKAAERLPRLDQISFCEHRFIVIVITIGVITTLNSFRRARFCVIWRSRFGLDLRRRGWLWVFAGGRRLRDSAGGRWRGWVRGWAVWLSENREQRFGLLDALLQNKRKKVKNVAQKYLLVNRWKIATQTHLTLGYCAFADCLNDGIKVCSRLI